MELLKVLILKSRCRNFSLLSSLVLVVWSLDRVLLFFAILSNRTQNVVGPSDFNRAMAIASFI